MTENRGLSAEQYEYLMKPIKASRISSRNQGGKSLSYVEAWDIKAHLTRIFGFCNWDSEMIEYHHVADRAYTNQSGGAMVEVIYSVRIRLTIRDQGGAWLCTHAEAAVGSASGPENLLGDLHDNALKTAASDALKRCAINLGTQFGLSLYDNGKQSDVIKVTLVKPDGVSTVEVTTEQEGLLKDSLGAIPIPEPQAQDVSHG